MKKLKLEINQNHVSGNEENVLKNRGIMITPPINKDYWTLRIHLYEDQYIQAFQKFMTLGIGFAIEDDWNTNLPYTCDAEEILNHIWHNRRYVAIKKKRTLRAIKMIQDFIKEND